MKIENNNLLFNCPILCEETLILKCESTSKGLNLGDSFICSLPNLLQISAVLLSFSTLSLPSLACSWSHALFRSRYLINIIIIINCYHYHYHYHLWLFPFSTISLTVRSWLWRISSPSQTPSTTTITGLTKAEYWAQTLRIIANHILCHI